MLLWVADSSRALLPPPPLCAYFFPKDPMPRNWKEEEEEDTGEIENNTCRNVRQKKEERRRRRRKERKDGRIPKMRATLFLKQKSQKRQLVPKNVKNKGKLHWEGNIFFSFFSVPIYAAEFDLTFGIPPVLISTRKRKRRNFIFYKRGIVRKERISLFFRLGC